MTVQIGAGPAADAALLDLLSALKRADYRFVTPTPATHSFVRQRSSAGEDVLRDVFGWSRPFNLDQLPQPFALLMEAAGILQRAGDAWRSTLRVSSVGETLYLHSAPSRDNDAVFLGPDSYRFARFLASTFRSGEPFKTALDLGTGAGVGALTLKAAVPEADVTASDINPAALRLARLNGTASGHMLHCQLASGIPDELATFEVIVSNPPYIAGDVGKTYRDGGDEYGAALALSWVRASAGRLTPGGRFILYTGAPVVAGRDVVMDALVQVAAEQERSLQYEELDPDVFGSTLRQTAYQSVERIAAVGAILTQP